ncbi:hypothetical protein CsSME_00047389 [Camellia sinensis var. sinensis]
MASQNPMFVLDGLYCEQEHFEEDWEEGSDNCDENVKGHLGLLDIWFHCYDIEGKKMVIVDWSIPTVFQTQAMAYSWNKTIWY